MVRSGKYKLVRQHSEGFRQLYDMDMDRTEMHDLSLDRRDVYAALSQKYDAWENEARVLPWERAGRYMSFHGFGNYQATFKQEFVEALASASPDEVVDDSGRGVTG